MCKNGYIATCPKCGTSVLTGPLPDICDLEKCGIKYECSNCGLYYLISTQTFIPRQ